MLNNETHEKNVKTILMADDEPNYLEAYADLLREEGYDVVCALDSDMAWEIYKNIKPRLVISDIKMPGNNELEFIERVNQDDPSMPVILTTGYPSLDTAVYSVRLGVVAYYMKPVPIEDLLLQVKKCFERSALESEVNRFKNLSSLLTQENKRLKKRIKQFSHEFKEESIGTNLDKYRIVCGAIAHNLNGEFFHIGNSVRGLRGMVGASSDIQEECDIIERSIEYSQILMRRLLDYLDIGMPGVESINIVKLLKRIELLIKPRLASNIEFAVQMNANIINTKKLFANFEQIMGVLLELIQNASTVLREKGGTIQLSIEDRNTDIAFVVKDNGTGIPLELKSKILIEQVLSKSGGLGIGLFLCNKVVAESGGKLKLEDSSEKGTTFTILLPLADDRQGA